MKNHVNTVATTDVSLAEALDHLVALSHARDLTPEGYSGELSTWVEKIKAAEQQLDIQSLSEAIDASAQLIAVTADVEPGTIARFHSDKVANRIHRARHTLASAVAATAYQQAVDADELIGHIAPICLRGHKARSFCDDEILLLRLIVSRDLEAGARRATSSLRYTLTDGGLVPSETTAVTYTAFSIGTDATGNIRPVKVRAPGVLNLVRQRRVKLDAFARASLAPCWPHT